MEYHLYANLIPRMSQTEYDSLRDDIAANGLFEAIYLYDGKILDGRHRYMACVECGIKPRYATYKGDDPIGFVVSENLKRRHLNAGQLAMVALAVEEQYAVLAKERQIESGKQYGKGKLKVLPEPAKPIHAAKEAAKITGASRSGIVKAKRVAKEAPDLAEKVKSGELPLDRAEKELKKRKRQQERESAPKASHSYLHVGDFRELGEMVADDSIDLIFCDPPYGYEHIADYEALAIFAARVLKPGASLICYSGQSVLPDVFRVMTPHINYHWTIALQHSGNTQAFAGKFVFIGWKPLLWFVKGKRRDENYLADFIKGNMDKQYHEWGQGESEAAYYIEHLTQESELVCDPFTGGGTTLMAAKKLNRQYLGFEIDEITANIAARRLNDG